MSRFSGFNTAELQQLHAALYLARDVSPVASGPGNLLPALADECKAALGAALDRTQGAIVATGERRGTAADGER